MSSDLLHLIDDDREIDVPAVFRSGGVRVAPGALAGALGWEVKPQGLCRGSVCVPLGEGDRSSGEGIDLADFAERVGRPLAVDLQARVACLGASAAQRSASLASLEAPDFTLPDIEGRPLSLAGFRGRKVLLIAWASW